MRRNSIAVIVGLGLVMMALAGAGCRTAQIVDPDKAAITKNCQMLFTRLKAGDKLVIYENEFPYYAEDVDPEMFLKHPLVVKYKVDTLYAMQVDSVYMVDTLIGGRKSAITALSMECNPPDSSLCIHHINMWWYKVGDKWIKPSTSRIALQNQFEEDIRIYQEAVKEKEKEQSQESVPDSSGK